ncbi:hypothetical protein BC830DRAFT_1087124 [Chytriomyces sp. MP71]|nr:hypothetical protein BC830DRAFT_1087124 [Chytriomyces sp. MP71]
MDESTKFRFLNQKTPLGVVCFPNYLELVPSEVLQSSLTPYLPVKSIIRFAKASKFTRGIIKNVPASVWYAMIQRKAATSDRKDPINLISFGPSISFKAPRERQLESVEPMLMIPSNPRIGAHSLSVILWFKCGPALSLPGILPTPYCGGVLYGAQSLPLTMRESWPGYHWHILSVDTSGTLRSHLESAAYIPPQVSDGEWHHVVLTSTAQVQALYLDGRLHTGDLTGNAEQFNQYWASQRQYHHQLGNGIMEPGENGCPSDWWCGPYPFQGSIFGFQIVQRVLDAEEVACLFAEKAEGRLDYASWAVQILKWRELMASE